MSRFFTAVATVLAAILLSLTPASAQRADTRTAISERSTPLIHGRIIVKTRAYPASGKAVEIPSRRVNAILQGAGVRDVRTPLARTGAAALLHDDRHGLGRIFEVTYDGTADPRQLARQLEATGDVEYAEPVPVRRPFGGAPSDSAYAMQYALQLIDAEGAWAITHGDSSVIIGIVDTGVDWEHEDLAANIWRNPREIPGNGIDDDGNGYVDDVRGWDLIGDVSMEDALAGRWTEDNDPKVRTQLDPGDLRNHGTHVAGIVAATGDNGHGIAGVAYGCRLMPVKTASDKFATWIFRGYEGILYCARNGASVVNCSWGGPTLSKVESDVIAEALDLGCVVVAAAGNARTNNDAYDQFPANAPGVISVGASGSDDAEAYFSNYGISTTLFAPGVDILSTVSGNQYKANSGTSMASPVVAGVAALIRSAHSDWTPAMIRSQLRSTSDSVLRGSATNRPAFFGRVNARRALTENVPAGRSLPGVVLAGTRWIDGGDTITSHSPRRLALRLHNNLATARNLSVVVAPIDPDISVTSGATATIDSMGRGEDREIEIEVAVADRAPWFSATLALQIGLRAGEYVDFLMAQVPISFATGARTGDITELVGEEFSAGAIDSPSPDVAWILGDHPVNGTVIIRVTENTSRVASVTMEAPVRVHGFDSLNCVVFANTSTLTTTDGGITWDRHEADTALGYFDEVLFFSPTEWCAAGLLDSGRIPIARTTNGGATWMRDTLDTGVPMAGNGFLNGSEWRGDNAWLGTATSGIMRSSDRGRTWQHADLDSTMYLYRIRFWTENEGLALCFGSGGLRIATSTDAGATWQIQTAPLRLSAGFAAIAVPGPLRSVYLAARNGSILTSMNGTDWQTVPSQRLRTDVDGAAISANDTLVRIWYVGPVSGYIDIPLSRSSAELPTAPASDLAIDAVHPNPAHDRLVARTRSHGAFTLEVIDLLGNVRLTQSSAGDATVTVPLDLPAGRYLLRVRRGGASSARSFVVE